MNNYTIGKKVKVRVPSRLHIDVMDDRELKVGKVGGGGIGLAVDMSSFITIEIIKGEKDQIVSKKDKLVEYILDLMRTVLNVDAHFKVAYEGDSRLKEHGGMASNASLQMGIAYGVNYLFESKLTDEELITIIQENYCEQEGEILTKEVFTSGVADNAVLYGGLCFVDKMGKLIYSKKLPDNLKVALIRADFGELSNNENEDKDICNDSIIKKNYTNNFYSEKEKIIRNEIIPDLMKNQYESLKKNMKKFAKLDSSCILAQNCMVKDFTYEELSKMIESVANSIIRVCSNSPFVCVITDNTKKIKEICDKFDIEMVIYDIDNEGMEIVESI